MPKTKLVPTVEELEKNDEIEVKEVKKEKKRVFEQSDGVMCRSVVHGNLYVEGIKTQMIYSFSDYGDETEIEYRDLAAAVRSKDKSVYEPRFIVIDEDFIKEFPSLKKFYDTQFTTKDIRAILNMPEDEMIKAIKTLPNGAVESLKSIAAKQISSGQLDSVRKIKALDELFGTDLNLVSDLFTNS